MTQRHSNDRLEILAQLVFGADATAPTPPVWVSLPGSTIELGDTGFTVKLNTCPDELPYIGRDPEGRAIVAGGDLSAIKRMLETHAAWRLAFAPQPSPVNLTSYGRSAPKG